MLKLYNVRLEGFYFQLSWKGEILYVNMAKIDMYAFSWHQPTHDQFFPSRESKHDGAANGCVTTRNQFRSLFTCRFLRKRCYLHNFGGVPLTPKWRHQHSLWQGCELCWSIDDATSITSHLPKLRRKHSVEIAILLVLLCKICTEWYGVKFVRRGRARF